MIPPAPTSSGLALRTGDFANLPQALDYAARGASGITLYSGRGEVVERLPHRDLREQALSLARKLRRTGLRQGDRVALIAATDGDFVRLFFGCQYAGLVPAPMPLPLAFGGRAAYLSHIRRMIEAAEASAAFAPAALAPWLSEAVEGLGLVWSGTAAELAALPETEADLPTVPEDHIAYLQFSSGSTRFPVGVAVTQRALMSNVRAIIRHGLDVRSGDRCTSWLPMYHDMGLVGFLLTPVAAQLSVDLLPTQEFARRPLMWTSLISSNGGTLSFSPSFGYELCARRAETAGTGDIDLSSWRVAGIGGDMIRAGVLERFARAFRSSGFRDSAFVASYGMAEATLAVSFAPLGRGIATDRLDVDRLEQDGVAVPADPDGARARDFARCGPVLPGHQLQVRGPDGQALPDLRVGRIFLRGPSLMLEYYRQPLATAATLAADGWLDTGDLGYLVGGEIVITGRAKDLILVNGRNIAPQDLEWTIEHELEGMKIGDVAAFSVAGDEGERVVLLVQCRTSEPDRREALRGSVETTVRKLHGIDCRAVLVPHNSLPHTSSGKLSRSRARQLYLDGAFAKPETGYGTQDAAGVA